jgi:hypothetical protein
LDLHHSSFAPSGRRAGTWPAAAFLFAALLLSSCTARKPDTRDLVGTWVHADGAILTLLPEGRFAATRLPAEILLDPDHKGRYFTGEGTWELVEGQARWEVHLSLTRERVGLRLLVEGSGAGTALFQWRLEEGGERYTLRRR